MAASTTAPAVPATSTSPGGVLAALARPARLLLGAVLLVHGAIHLLGPAMAWRLASIDGLPYRTAVLAGALDVGAAGTWLLGLLWALISVAFVVAGVLVMRAAPGATTTTAVVSTLSLLLCLLWLPETVAGAVIDVVVLLVLAAAVRLTERGARHGRA
jgi:hypothetical protein